MSIIAIVICVKPVILLYGLDVAVEEDHDVPGRAPGALHEDKLLTKYNDSRNSIAAKP